MGSRPRRVQLDCRPCGYHLPMIRPDVPGLHQRLRLHCWSLLRSYDGEVHALAAAACSHGGHQTDADTWACLSSEILSDFLQNPRNRDVVLAAIVASQEAA
jgi:hypothetical protein